MSGTLTHSSPPLTHTGSSVSGARRKRLPLVLSNELVVDGGASPRRDDALAPGAASAIPTCIQLGPDPEPFGLRFEALAEQGYTP
jgi:hypothetical protein